MSEVITSHINTDFDGLAGMLAARHLYPGAELVLPGSPERSLHEFFLNSCSYVYPFKSLKDFDLDPVTRLVIVDTRQASRIGEFARIAARPGVEVVVYDHHPASGDDLEKVDRLEVAEVGAVVTLLVEKLRAREISLPADEATIMLIGLYEDTGSLTFKGTTRRDFMAAAWLLEQGGDLETVAGVISNTLDREQVALLNDLLSSRSELRIRGHKVILVEASRDHYVSDAAMVVHRLRDIERCEILIALLRLDDKVYLIGRSHSPDLDMGRLMAHFDGGGHHSAASAVSRDLTLIQCREKVIGLLRQEIVPLLTASDLMTAPVLTITPETPLAEAAAILTRYNINVLPVVGAAGGEIRGLITRQVVEKALFHGLKELAVSEYMSTEFEPVSLADDLERINELIVERNQRFLPVTDDRGRVLGAITRKDLLRALYDQDDLLKEATLPAEGQRRVRRKSVKGLLQESFPDDLLAIFRNLGKVADEMGCGVFLVGGVVRDLMLRRPNLDIDIVVEGDGIALARAYREKFGGRCHSHEPFRTAVLMVDGYKLDIASTRLEYYDAPASLPKVKASSLKVDLYRRDFTINTLVVSLNSESYGELRDYFGAGRDLKEHSIRVLHNLSFVEDPTRIFRAVRFEQKFNFTIGRQTLHLIQNALKIGFVRRLSGSRVLNEIKLICAEPDPLPIFARMGELKLWSEIFPELGKHFDRESLAATLKAVKEVVTWYEYLYLEQPVKAWQVYLLALMDGLGADQADYFLARLGFDENRRRSLVKERYRGIEAAQQLGRCFRREGGMAASRLVEILAELPLEVMLYVMAGHENEAVKKAISGYLTRLQFVTLEITGNDLVDLGLTPGPRFKEVLDEVLKARLDGEVGNREEELALARRLALEEARPEEPVARS